MIEEATKFLFRKGAHTYAVLDGAAVRDLPMKLFDMRPHNLCLYRGELSDEMIHVAPYLVHLAPDGKFTNWLLGECWGKNWGIFAQTPLTINGMRKHFRSLLTVYNEDGNPLLFRYYDPRVLLKFVATCSVEELAQFFGEVKYYFAETEDGTALRRYNFAKDKLNKTNLSLT